MASDVVLSHCRWWLYAMFVGGRWWLLGTVVTWRWWRCGVVVPGVVDGGWKKDVVDY